MTATQPTPARKPRPEFPWSDTRVIDGLTVEIRASETARFGRSEAPGVTIRVIDPQLRLNALYGLVNDDTLASATLPAPGRDVYEPDTRNRIGRPGAVRFHWADDWRGAWLDQAIRRLVADAQTILAARQAPQYSDRILRAVSAVGYRMDCPAWEDMERAIQRIQSGAPEDGDDELTAMLRNEIDRSRVDGHLIDQDATLTIRRITRTRGNWVEYRMSCRLRTAPDAAEELRGAWGGSITQETTPQGAPRSTVLWQISGKPLAWMLETTLPYLERQHDMAQLMLELRTIMDARPAGGQRPEDVAAQLEAIYQRSLALRG